MKKLLIAVVVFLMVVMIALPIYASPKSPADYNGLNKGNSSVYHLYLYEKTGEPDWNIVEGGAWGKLTFNTAKDTFVFNGHKLMPDTDYTLIRFVDPWNGQQTVLASGMTNGKGNINLKGTFDNWSEKFWLVPSIGLNVDTLSGWNPSTYLFEYNVLELD